LLNTIPYDSNYEEFAMEPGKDPEIKHLLHFLKQVTLPGNPDAACKVAVQAPLFALVDGALYLVNFKQCGRRQCMVPVHLEKTIIEEHYRLYKVLLKHWWWQGMYGDILAHCRSCPQYAIVNASAKLTDHQCILCQWNVYSK